MRAILSVYDKTGLIEFARGLLIQGYDLFSTGGTRRVLEEAGVAVHSISELTKFPEILDGRVKTLHPAVHGGILARREVSGHLAELEANQIGLIDLVAVNLYPFQKTVAKPGIQLDEALENIDIGGPTMVRAAAKNFRSVLVVVDPADYEPLLGQMRRGGVAEHERRKLAQKAFQHVAAYDTAIAQYLRGDEQLFTDEMTIAMKKKYDLRYGENPHQQAAFYEEERIEESTGISSAKQLWGKELSFNNILDTDAAWNVVADFKDPAVAIIKHTNPCGLASRQNLTEAYECALSGDPVAAYGGIVAINRYVDIPTAREVAKTFYEVIIAPGFEDKALDLLKQRRDVRILVTGETGDKIVGKNIPALDFRRVNGGFLVQTPDCLPDSSINLRTVTKRGPAEDELRDLLFAWKAVKHVKSNAIVLARESMILGMGAGQPSRVVSVEIALKKAGERSRGSVLGSDAFFPFPDGVQLAGEGGVTAIIQPGGSMRDNEAIEMADKYKMAMVFTGVRHFRH